MVEPDKITDEKRFAIIHELQRDRTIIRLNLLGKKFEGLTMVTGMNTINNVPYILIDRPNGSKEYLENSTGNRVFLEFIGKDRIQYHFKTVIEKAVDDDILIQFPEVINRVQRRKYFRIEPPFGTRMTFKADNRHFKFNVINLSMGGVLIAQDMGLHDKGTFFVGRYIRDILLICEEDGARARIKIKKADLIRIEKNEETGKCFYAIKFLDMDKDTREKLHVYIYCCQRVVLKRWGSLSKD